MIFDKKPQFAEGDVVENAQNYLNEKIKDGEFVLPAGVNYKFTGNYENQIRATKRLLLVVPISLIIIFLILYFQFNSVTIIRHRFLRDLCCFCRRIYHALVIRPGLVHEFFRSPE